MISLKLLYKQLKSLIAKKQETMGNDNVKEICTDWNSFMDWHIRRYHENRARGMVTHDTLEFPIMWDRSVPVLEHLFYLYKYYIAEVKDSRKCEKETTVKNIEAICNGILNSYRIYMEKGIADAVDELRKIECLRGVLEATNGVVEKDVNLYRLRSDAEILRVKDAFMHVPFDRTYLCNSMRFSLPGEPCMYLGYSEAVCRIEFDKFSGGSMGHFQTNAEIKVIDLTLDCQGNSKANLFMLWPILAACYVTPDRTGNFKEEYIFPQIIMRYIKDEFFECDPPEFFGIRYYTCRKPDLDTSCKEYQNVALFTENTLSKSTPIDVRDDYPFHITRRFDEKLWNMLKFIP